MANRCEYKVIVKGKKNACYAFYGSMRVLENKWIKQEEGAYEAHTLRFEGDCKWSVNYECNSWEGETPVTLPDDPKKAEKEAEEKYWFITVRERSRMFGVEVWCNSADVEYNPDEPEERFEHYVCGVHQACECPEELRIEGDGLVYAEETGEWMDRDECEELERERRPLQEPLTFELVGTQHDGRTERIERAKQGDTVKLVRETDNPYDQYAIDVVSGEGSLGHVPRIYTENLARQLEKGTVSNQARVTEVTPLSQRTKRARKPIIKVTVYPANWQESASATYEMRTSPKTPAVSDVDGVASEFGASPAASVWQSIACVPTVERATINDDLSIAIPDGMIYSTDKTQINNNRSFVAYKTEMNDYYLSENDPDIHDFSSPFNAPQCLTMMDMIPWPNPVSFQNIRIHAENLLRRMPFCCGDCECVMVKAQEGLVVCYGRNGKYSTMYVILTKQGIYSGQLWVNDTPGLEESYAIMENWLEGISLATESLTVSEQVTMSQIKSTSAEISDALTEAKKMVSQRATFMARQENAEKADAEAVAPIKMAGMAADRSEDDVVNMCVILTNEKKLGKLNRSGSEFVEMYRDVFPALSETQMLNARGKALTAMQDAGLCRYYGDRFKQRPIKDRFAISTLQLHNANEEQDPGVAARFAIDNTKEWYSPSEYDEVSRLMVTELAETRRDIDEQLKSVAPSWTKYVTARQFLHIVLEDAGMASIRDDTTHFQIMIDNQVARVILSTAGLIKNTVPMMNCFSWYYGTPILGIWEDALRNEVVDKREFAYNGQQFAKRAVEQIRAKYSASNFATRTPYAVAQEALASNEQTAPRRRRAARYDSESNQVSVQTNQGSERRAVLQQELAKQQEIVNANKFALFGQGATMRKAAKQRIEEIEEELQSLRIR